MATEFPYFSPILERPLTGQEYAVVAQLLVGQRSDYREQLTQLAVVGRCGCQVCPTIFFHPHAEDDYEHDLIHVFAKDETGGVVGVSLLAKNGMLSQLEVYTADGHDPYFLPRPEDFISASNF